MAHTERPKLRSVAWLSLFLLSAAGTSPRVEGQASAGYSEYIIPANEGATTGSSTQVGLYYALDQLDNGAPPVGTNMHSVIAVTAWAPNTTVYYDHWEDGLDFDPNNPSTADRTVILLTTGQLQTFESANFAIPVAATTTGTGCNWPTPCTYDGGDRMYVAGGAVTVTRSGWVEVRQVANQAVAWEIYPVKPQLTTYVVPFGENLGFPAFERVIALIQATADNTTFQVDLNGDGTFDLLNANRNATKDGSDPADTTTVTLNTGQTFLLDRISACSTNFTTCDTNPGLFNSGAVVQGSSTLQVKFVAGQTAVNYCARGLSAFPRGFWTKSYYAPLDQRSGANGSGTDYILHNPHATPLTVTWQSRTGTGSFTIPAQTTIRYGVQPGAVIPVDSGLYFSAPDVFWGVGLGDVTGQAYEWGYSLLPSTFLSAEHFLGWAPGSIGGTGAGDYDDVGVFLTVAQDNTTVFVDFDNDGAANQTFTLNRLQTQFIYDITDGNLSGAHFWATGDFTLAYGENADTANASSPSLDLGYVAIPGTDFISLVLGVEKSVSPQVVSAVAGSTAEFTIVTSTREYALDAVTVVDTLPPNWRYVTGTTTITRPDLGTSNANPSIIGAGTLASPYVLSWPASVLDPSGMAPNQKITVKFTAETMAALTVGTVSQNRVLSAGTRTVGSPAVTQTFSATDFAFVVSGDLQIAKTSSAPTPLYPGDQFTYTVTVTNPPGGATQTGVSIFDALPAGTTFVNGTGSVVCEFGRNVRDEFATSAYTNNGPNNTASWATDWTETDAAGGGAASGLALVTGGALRLAQAENVRDEFGTAAYSNNGPNATGTWAGSWTETDAYGGGATGATGGFVLATGTVLQFRYLLSTVRDQFSSAAYNLSTGSDNWTGSWTESTGLDGVATTVADQQIYVAGGVLFLDQATNNTFAVSRTANVATGSSATISFTPVDSGIDGGEAFVAEYSIDGGGFTTIGTYDGGTGGWSGAGVNFPIASFPGTALTLRFRATGAWSGGNDEVEIDNVQISYNSPVNAAGTLVLRTADLSGATTATLSFTTASANLEAADTLVVEASSSGSGTFTTLATYVAGTPSAAGPYDLTPYISATTTIRFRVTGGYDAANETFSIDNVDITYKRTPTAIQRTADLTGAAEALLSFTAAQANLEAGDTLVVEASSSASGPFTTLATYTAGTPSAAGHYSLTPYVSATTTIRFRISGGYDMTNESLSFDNVDISYFVSTTVSGLTPPSFLGSSTGCRIRGGNSATLTFNVTVDDPFPVGSTLLTNTAATTTAQFPIQITASVTDQLTIPTVQSATVAGRVWLDADGDGVQDIGEPGLGNVEVTLKDQFGTPVATLTTNANGRYLFTGVTPGNGYYVEVTSGLPAGVVQSYPTGLPANRTAAFSLAEGQNYTGADLGYRPQPGTVTFGDLTWVDADNDQVKDLGEIGLGGVRIRLYRDADGDGFLAPLVDTLVGEPATGPGTVNVTSGSTTVTGTSTRFTTLAAGDPITIAGVTYSIASVSSNTQLVLGSVYTGTTGTARPYTAGTAEGPGTVVATNASAIVTGAGTTFTSLEPGDPIVIGGVRYRVQSVTSDTLLTLTSIFTGTSGAGLPYGLANATFSAADGSYLFTGAPATGAETYFVSAAAPAGYISTTGSVSRFQGVAAGSVFLTADFGFRSSGTTYSISDRIWLDADADKYYDGGATEPGIGGVTVSLLDASLNVIGTTTTAGDGTFTFSGLTGGGADYTVRVSDANGVLADFTGTTEYATARERAEPNLSGDVDRRTAAAWPNGPSYGFLTTRAIGDSVYYDVNGNGTQDLGENGFAGVPVSLYRDVNGDDTLSLSAKANVTVTNGSATVTGAGFLNYHAGEPVVIAGALYTIQSVSNDTTLTLTASYTGASGSQVFLAPTAGPGTVGVTNGSATVTGSGFLRYRAGEPITINNGGTSAVYTILSVASDTSLILTTNYAGTTNGARTYYGPGDALVGSVTTDATGQFLFAGLPARDYVVSVPVPAGYDHIPGTRTDTDGTSPGVQLAATVSGSANVLDRDFGFQAPSAGGVQGTIWSDADGNGTIGGTEAERFAGVTVEVLSGSTVVATLTTDANGFYSVAGLAAGSYTVRVTDTSGILTGNVPTTSTSLSVAVTANINSTADFGFRRPTPTYAAVSYLRAFVAGGTVVVEWQTTQEVGTVGFDLLRLDPKSGEFAPVHDSLLPGLLGHPGGGTYTFQDTGAPLAAPLTYLLVEVDVRGTSREYGPYLVSAFGSGAAPSARYQRTSNVITREEEARVATLKRERGATTAARSGQKGSRVKVATREAGLHLLDSASLAALLGEKPNSFASRVSSGRVVLENLGAVVPYLPAVGGSGLYFYGEKLENPFTDENVYWVAARRGATMATSNGSPTGRPPQAAFTETVHSEVDRYPLPVFFQEPEADFYTWDYFYAGYPGEDTRTFSTSLAGVAGAGQPNLTVRLHGGSDTAAPDEHRVRITWNGRIVGEATWDGLVATEITIPLGAADVVEGANTLVLTAILEPGLEYDVVYLDSFDVSYERVYRAVGDELSFRLPAGAEAAVAGFSWSTAVILDVTEPFNPVLVTGATTFAPGDGTYGLRLANRGASERSYLAVVPARAKSPVSVTPGRIPALTDSTNGADYLLVAPPSLLAAAESLAAYRRSRGLDTKVVDLADVYDEFGHGLATPIAIRNFLAWSTAEWARAPEYVTLVGRGTFDYKDVQGVGDSVMPTLLAGTPYGLVASDVSFAELSTGVGRGVKAIGRLPVLASQELLDYVAKVQAHEAAPTATWQQNLLLIADNPDAGGAFTADSDAVGALAPATFLNTKVYLTTHSAPDARTAIRNTVNSGALLFNYIGHGGPDRLAEESIFTKVDVPTLTNAGRLPVFLAMTCSTGNFAIPGFPSLGESIVLWKSGGAYVTWAPSGLSLNVGARALNEAFFRGAFVEGEKVVGRNCTKALEGLPATGPMSYMKVIYNIIGEPVARLP